MAEQGQDGGQAPRVRVQVAGSKQQEVGRGVARIGQKTLQELGIREGDIVEVLGKQSTAAVALPPYPEDEGLEIVRLDGLQRANADVSIGDHVEVRRAEVKPARRVTIAPVQPNLRLMGSGDALRRTLFRRPLVAGDVISTAAYQQGAARGPGAGQLPEEVLRNFFQQQATYGLQEVRLRVVSTTPRGVVQVNEETEIELLPEYVEVEEPRRADVTYDDIGGLGDTIDQVREMIELPLKHPELFQRLGIDPPKGVLLHGPPGTGKTLLAKAVARQVAPTVIFIDEIDSLAPQRGGGLGEPAVTERVVNTMLAEMDGLEELQGIVVIGATNRPTLLDPALLRPGRFDELIYIPVPEREGRLRILGIHTRGMPLADDVELESLAERTEGYTGADLEDLVRRAGLQALRESLEIAEIPMRFFEAALGETRASVTPEMEREYEEIRESLKRESPRGLRRIGFTTEAMAAD